MPTYTCGVESALQILRGQGPNTRKKGFCPHSPSGGGCWGDRWGALCAAGGAGQVLQQGLGRVGRKGRRVTETEAWRAAAGSLAQPHSGWQHPRGHLPLCQRPTLRSHVDAHYKYKIISATKRTYICTSLPIYIITQFTHNILEWVIMEKGLERERAPSPPALILLQGCSAAGPWGPSQLGWLGWRGRGNSSV